MVLDNSALAGHGELEELQMLGLPVHQHDVGPQVGDGDVGRDGAAAGRLVPEQVAVYGDLGGVDAGDDVREDGIVSPGVPDKVQCGSGWLFADLGTACRHHSGISSTS